MALAYPLVLSLALAAFFRGLLEEKEGKPSGSGVFESFFLLTLFGISCLLWTRDPRPTGAASFPMPLTPGTILWLGLPCAVFGALSFAALGRSLRWLATGFWLGVFLSLLGFCAYRWLGLSEAVRRLGDPVSAAALRLLLPLALGVSVGFSGLAAGHPDFQGRRLKCLMALFLLWSAPTLLVEWRLRTAWGYGPRDWAAAAEIGPASLAPAAAVAELRFADPRIAARRQAGQSLDLSPDNLVRLTRYLREQGGRSIFAREAAEAVRKGALLWWDADLAVWAHCLSQGMAYPDYRQALALLRAGPLTNERFEKLRGLMTTALNRKDGFESINQSQFIFEAFSNAFGRFGSSDLARFWLQKIDGLWPVYEKKIEVSPVEIQREGEITGSLALDGRPASDVKVGLFYLASSTDTYREGSNLCCSQYPDSGGNFHFSNLGAGKYYLALQADPVLLRGRILGSPGVIDIPELASRPVKRLEVISIERSTLLPP